jgi:hypothetical protein
VERDHDQSLFYINQIGYFKEIFKHFRMEDCKAIGIPFDTKAKLKKTMNKDVEMVGVPYQQVVESLMYAMQVCTQLNLAYPISMVSQHMANPNLEYHFVQ